MQPARFTSAAAHFLAVLFVLGAQSCGAKTEDLVAMDGHQGATGGAGYGSLAGAASTSANAGGAGPSGGGGSSALTTQATSVQHTGGAPTASTTTVNRCTGVAVPSANGSFVIGSWYVNAISLRGYGFTFVGDRSNDSTYICPSCGDTGCMPSLSTTALCAAGVVGADANYQSAAGIGVNLNQGYASGELQTIPAPEVVTYSIAFDDRSGNSAARLVLVAIDGDEFCVDTYGLGSNRFFSWEFNTHCWDGSGEALTSGIPIIALHVTIPSDATMDRPFGFCLMDIWFGTLVN